MTPKNRIKEMVDEFGKDQLVNAVCTWRNVADADIDNNLDIYAGSPQNSWMDDDDLADFVEFCKTHPLF